MKTTDFLTVLKGTAEVLERGGEPPRCPLCQSPMDLKQQFCGSCGRRLRFACTRCQAECRLGQKFCTTCGFEFTPEVVAALEVCAASADEEKREAEKKRQEEEARRLEAKRQQEKQPPPPDPMSLFTDVEKLGEQRCLKMRARRCDSGELRFLKKTAGGKSAELLENESAVLTAVSHPHLIKLHAVHRQVEVVLLEFQHVHTRDIRFPLSIERLCRIMHQVAQALAALHERGFVHADIKPQNILLSEGARPGEDEAVVCDLELAQAPGPSRFNAMTPLFAAPEQMIGDRLDFRTDVYAFGTLFYLWFIFDRLPAIVDVESVSYQAMGPILKSVPRFLGTPLHELTQFGPVIDRHSALLDPLKKRFTSPVYQASEEELLGAKYHFGAELERITHINRRLDLTEEILKLVCEATEVEPAKRPANGSVLVERMEGLLKKLGNGPNLRTEGNEIKSGDRSAELPAPGTVSKTRNPAAKKNGAEGVFARQAELEKRLKLVPRRWRNPLSSSRKKIEMEGDGLVRAALVSLDKEELRRIR